MSFLQRMPQSAKVALVLVLLVGAVATWYLSFFRPSQIVQQPITPTPAPVEPGAATIPGTSTTARPLEVLPLPFLVTEATQPAERQNQEEATASAALTRPRVTVPLNPFVPLVVETVPPAVAQPTQPAPTPTLGPQPIPSQAARVLVRQPITPLPHPSLPGTRLTTGVNAPSGPTGQARLAQGTARTSLPGVVRLGSGMLPIRLAPLDRELTTTTSTPEKPAALDIDTSTPTAAGVSGNLDFVRTEIDARLTQTLEPKTSLAKDQETVQDSLLARYVREQNIKLSGVVLGPTSVAILQSKDGFIVLPVGRTLPGSDVLLRSLSAQEALLIHGSESLNLTLDNP